jgi:hypothetical protein
MARRIAAATAGCAFLASPDAFAAISVKNRAQFARAVERLTMTGGTIVVLPNRYSELVVGPRGPRWLRILVRPRATAGRVVFTNTRAVKVSGLDVTPRSRRARLRVVGSRKIHFARLRVEGTPRFGANAAVASSSRVRFRRSEFARCGGGRPPTAGYCLRLGKNRDVTIVASRFEDCSGCDFIHGSGNSNVTIRRSGFHRALAGACGRGSRCPHQDLVQLIGGRDVVIDANRFGLYEFGAAQVYLTGGIRRATVTNNVFLVGDPLVPDSRAKVGLLVGNPFARDVPRDVVVKQNTILSGGVRWIRGEPGRTVTSVYLSRVYARIPVGDRPILANNVLARVETPRRLCPRLRRSVRNVIARGTACSATDVVGDPMLDAHGRPTAGSSLVINRAAAQYATAYDIRGVRRNGRPDIGAYEYVGR